MWVSPDSSDCQSPPSPETAAVWPPSARPATHCAHDTPPDHSHLANIIMHMNRKPWLTPIWSVITSAISMHVNKNVWCQCSLISLTMIQKSCYVLPIIFSRHIALENPRNCFPCCRTRRKQKHNENDKAHKHYFIAAEALHSLRNTVTLSFSAHFVIDVCHIQSEHAFSV